MKRFTGAYAAILLVAAMVAVRAASIPFPFWTGPQDPSAMQQQMNLLAQSVNQNASGYQPLNFLDNGAMWINQRAVALAATGGGTSGPSATAYPIDRWAAECNVGSCAPRAIAATSAAGVTFAPACANMVSLYRNSGALTQPIQLEQELETNDSVLLQGRPVILSAWLAANTGAPSGVTATFHVFYGTGTNEGLGASTVYGSAVGMTASPALTPAMTGVGTAGSYTTPALTTTATRYSSAQIWVPATATELIAEVDWTPGAETAGTTDGILVGCAQLEEADVNQQTAGRFYRPPYQQDLARSQRFHYTYVEGNPGSGYVLGGSCNATGSAAGTCVVPFPVPMAASPQGTLTAAGHISINLAGTVTALTSPTFTSALQTSTGYGTFLHTTTGQTAGDNYILTSGTSGGGKIDWSADF